MSVAIVVNAYNRPAALARLLASLQQAAYPADVPVPLIISIDRGGSADVRTLAHNFAWPHGPLEVIVQEQHLGLVQHFFACGDLTQRYDAIVYLEDDLTVSPVFFAYATQSLSFYQHEERVAGLSLFGLWFNGYTSSPSCHWTMAPMHFSCKFPTPWVWLLRAHIGLASQPGFPHQRC